MSVGDEPMTEAAGGVIERELHIDAPPEIVFGFFTDPDRMARWMGRTITLDPSPGGAYRIDYNGSDVASGDVRRGRRAPPDRVHLGLGGARRRGAAGREPRRGDAHGRRCRDPCCASATAASRPSRSRVTPKAGTTSCRPSRVGRRDRRRDRLIDASVQLVGEHEPLADDPFDATPRRRARSAEGEDDLLGSAGPEFRVESGPDPRRRREVRPPRP